MEQTFGRYRLLERLGKGGMAEVFKAKSFGVEGFEKILVIKRILPELAKNADFVDMFIHEAKLAVRLSHANIVQVFDLGIAPSEGGDAYFMAMEYVHGLDLASLLSRTRKLGKPLGLEMALYIAAEVAKGLDHAHRRRDEQMRPLGIVHRDVSPQNVLLSFEGEVKVTDFGIAKARHAAHVDDGAEDTSVRKIQGKFAYMSPEQARGEPVDARSDLFSLGVVLYETVSGTNPFSAPSVVETLRRVQLAEFPPIELLLPDIPSEFALLLHTALAKNPDQRFSDAGRMYEAILSFLYTRGSRFGAHDLAAHLERFREEDESEPVASWLLPEAPSRRDTTEVEPPSLARLPAVSDAERSGEWAHEVGERRHASVLVVELPRQEWGAVSATLMDKTRAVIQRYGGTLQGDEPGQCVALFGLRDPDGRDTEMATRAGFVAMRLLGGLATAGVAMGRVHVAEDELIRDEPYLALVDAARDLARAGESGLWVSPEATKVLSDHFQFFPTAGGAKGVRVEDPRGAPERYGRFVGRKDELRMIGETLALATKRNPAIFTLRGDQGVGKTRTLFEVERRLRKGNYNVGFYVASCPPRGAEVPLSGIVCMLHVLCGIAEGDPPERVLAVRPRLRALGLTEEEVSRVLHVLGAGIPLGTLEARPGLRTAFQRIAQSLSDDRPQVFAWDAAHAMDADSYGILEQVLDALPNARLVFAFAVRGGFSHPLAGRARSFVIELRDLRVDDSERLMAVRLGVERVPEELVQFVRERAGGHPLFVEEILKALVDAKAVTVAEGAVVSMRLLGQGLSLPRTLRGLIASRAAKLSTDERAVLQAAAVLGDSLDVNVLSAMLMTEAPALERTLTVLKDREFLVDTGALALRFASPLIPEVLVDALPFEHLRDMHASAGMALASAMGERVTEHASRVARHLYEAGDREGAATYFAKSAEHRMAGRELLAASRDYARALLLSDVETRDAKEVLQWFQGLSEAVRTARQVQEAPRIAERVLVRVDRETDAELRVKARTAAGELLGALHQGERAREYFSAAEKLAEGSPALLQRVLISYADQATESGDFRKAEHLLEQLSDKAREPEEVPIRHKVLMQHAEARAALGQAGEALSLLSQCESLLPKDPVANAARTRLRGFVEQSSRQFASAALYFEKAADMARREGLAYQEALSLLSLGDALVRSGDRARAYGALKQSLALSEEGGFSRLKNLGQMQVAYLDALAHVGNGLARLESAIAYAVQENLSWDTMVGQWLVAQYCRERGDVERGRREALRVYELAEVLGHKLFRDDADELIRRLGGAPAVPS